MNKTIKVKLIKSPIGYNRNQRKVLQGLGLRKLNHTVTLEESASTLGMVKKISHLVKIVEE